MRKAGFHIRASNAHIAPITSRQTAHNSTHVIDAPLFSGVVRESEHRARSSVCNRTCDTRHVGHISQQRAHMQKRGYSNKPGARTHGKEGTHDDAWLEQVYTGRRRIQRAVREPRERAKCKREANATAKSRGGRPRGTEGTEYTGHQASMPTPMVKTAASSALVSGRMATGTCSNATRLYGMKMQSSSSITCTKPPSSVARATAAPFPVSIGRPYRYAELASGAQHA
mmetsp:Transcript_12056/g.30375  ORF Transcript_12056/g.30375 Transcript_12056/m.30375 type:complete len:227 (+) Transcript_12056:99-779(+)